MTIYDSKGLEFNDVSSINFLCSLDKHLSMFEKVLLYNFFADSPAKLSQWRVILSALSDQSAVAAPEFERNRQRYASICTEVCSLFAIISWVIETHSA
jgi:hypothetical protein